MRAALISALSLPVAALAQDQEAQPELSENTSEGLEKLRPMLDAKDWTGSVALVNTLLAKAGPDSYDTAFLSDTLGKLYLQKGEYDKAVPPMEAALRLSERHPKFFRASTVQDMRYYLAQIYYQNSAAVKNPAQQMQGFSKANAFLELWLANSKRPNSEALQQDAIMFHAMLLYNMAVINPEKIDAALIAKAEAEVDHGLHMSAHPKENLYTLLLAICQQKNDYVRASEILEILVRQYPNKKEYWSQLVSVYLNLAQDKNEDKSRQYNIRGIITIERAQALGFMKTPKENFNLVGVYFNVGQFGRATELLYSGLKSAAIDSDQKNWELLAYSYQQVDKPAQAVEVLKEAAQIFPQSGQLDYQAAQIYYGISKSDDAFLSLQSAVKKGHLDKPGAVYGFLAYVSFELMKYDDALAAAEKALTYPDSKNDAQLPKLRQAVLDAIKERELQKAQTEAIQKA
jgi:tetratricopeptide (TPR) repeat protein